MQLEPFLRELTRVLPPEWKISLAEGEPALPDALLTIAGPNGSAGQLLVEMRPRLSARQAAEAGPQLMSMKRGGNVDGAIVFTRFASQMARERLRSAGISYLDLTGNVWISLSTPAVFIQCEGAQKDPDPPRRGVRSLKGAKAARIVRYLCDTSPPFGVRDLARRTGTDPGYVTRVLSFLERDDLVVRGAGGEVVDVRWADALRRWGRDYSLTGTNRTSQYLAPRGLGWLREKLLELGEGYAVTGSFAIPPEVQVAPSTLLSCYVTRPTRAVEVLELRETRAGANVLLLDPFDKVVLERTRLQGDLVAVALSQCVVDLLTGPGREPAQGEALISWMVENEGTWRS